MSARLLFLLALLIPGCASRTAPDSWGVRFPDADTVRVADVAPGIRHIYLWSPPGQAVHVVAVDEARCAPRVVAVKAGPPLDERARTSALGSDATVALNGDFFMTPGGTPVGAHVTGGRVLVGPGDRPVYLVTESGDAVAGPAYMLGHVAALDTVPLVQVNRPVAGDRHHPPRPGVTLFDHWFGSRLPGDTAVATIRARRVTGGAEPEGAAGTAVIEAVVPPGEPVALGPTRVALRAVGPAATRWIERRAPGDTLTWTARLAAAADGAPVAAEAVGGFPVLVDGGRGVYGEQAGVPESFGDARHPRTAVAWSEGRLLWVVVDGRQAPYALGMTLSELETLLLRLGATDGINLDGGGSSTLVIRGRVANRPSDEEGERPVGNALAIRGCRGP